MPKLDPGMNRTLTETKIY